MLKLSYPTLLLLLSLTALKAQSQPPLTVKDLNFTKLIYHSTRCFGTCPAIDMEIDSNRNIILHREIYKGKGEIDYKPSGSFKGRLNPKTYFKLMSILINSNYTKWVWPDEFCCDAPITTIIVYAQGTRTRLTSMFPPQQAGELIDFLLTLGTHEKIPSTGEHFTIEQ